MKPRHWIVAGASVATLAFCTLAIIFVVGHSNPVVKDDPMLFRTSGYANRIQIDGSSIRVTFDWDRITFLINDSAPALIEMLNSAHDSGESISLRVQLAGAHFDPTTGLPVFRVQYAYYRDQTFGPFDAKIPWSWRVLTEEQLALLKGVGYQNSFDFNAALTEFDKGLRGDRMRPSQRGLALALRAEAYERKFLVESTRVGKDYLLVRSSEAYAEAAKIRRDDFSLLISRAAVLVQLGAYEDALTLLRPALAASGETHFRAGIMSAEVLRSLGRTDEALRILDDVGAREPDMLGMMYFYHRGRILLLLSRNPEAASAFSDGLKSQRGWPWVYIGRACARHEMGDVDAALADLRTAVQLADGSTERDTEETRGLRAELRNNIAALGRVTRSGKMSLCERFQPNFDQPLRERSTLLDSERVGS